MVKKKRNIVRFEDVRDRIVTIRGKKVILDFAVAELYGVETKEINRAVKNNPRKFPDGWVFELDKQELEDLRCKFFTANVADNQDDEDLQSKILTANLPSAKSRVMPKAFTERGIYMLATILTGDQAIDTTITIVDTFAKLHELQRNIGAMTQAPSEAEQKSLMKKSGEIVEDIFGDALATSETETEIELNFAVLKLKHKIKRKK
jgi:phage regulator Rha-like protein